MHDGEQRGLGQPLLAQLLDARLACLVHHAVRLPSMSAVMGAVEVDVVRAVADRHGVGPATIALAWLLTRSTVAAPIASGSRVEQLPALVASTTLELTPEDIADLDAVSG